MGLTARAGAAARFLFVSSAFVTKWGLNKMAYAGQGERLHVISVCVCVCVLIGLTRWIVGSCYHLNFNNFRKIIE